MKSTLLFLASFGFILALSNCRTTNSSSKSNLKNEDTALSAGKLQEGNIRTLLEKNLQNADFAHFALTKGLLTRVAAKNICSCVHVTYFNEGLTPEDGYSPKPDTQKNCFEHTSQFGTDILLRAHHVKLIGNSDVEAGHYVYVEGAFTGAIAKLLGVGSALNPPAVAYFNPRDDLKQYGCRLISDPEVVVKVANQVLQDQEPLPRGR